MELAPTTVRVSSLAIPLYVLAGPSPSSPTFSRSAINRIECFQEGSSPSPAPAPPRNKSESSSSSRTPTTKKKKKKKKSPQSAAAFPQTLMVVAMLPKNSARLSPPPPLVLYLIPLFLVQKVLWKLCRSCNPALWPLPVITTPKYEPDLKAPVKPPSQSSICPVTSSYTYASKPKSLLVRITPKHATASSNFIWSKQLMMH
jgi:hypothetical protein